MARVLFLWLNRDFGEGRLPRLRPFARSPQLRTLHRIPIDRLHIRLQAKVLLSISGGCPLAAAALSLTPEATAAVPEMSEGAGTRSSNQLVNFDKVD